MLLTTYKHVKLLRTYSPKNYSKRLADASGTVTCRTTKIYRVLENLTRFLYYFPKYKTMYINMQSPIINYKIHNNLLSLVLLGC